MGPPDVQLLGLLGRLLSLVGLAGRWGARGCSLCPHTPFLPTVPPEGLWKCQADPAAPSNAQKHLSLGARYMAWFLKPRERKVRVLSQPRLPGPPPTPRPAPAHPRPEPHPAEWQEPPNHPPQSTSIPAPQRPNTLLLAERARPNIPRATGQCWPQTPLKGPRQGWPQSLQGPSTGPDSGPSRAPIKAGPTSTQPAAPLQLTLHLRLGAEAWKAQRPLLKAARGTEGTANTRP